MDSSEKKTDFSEKFKELREKSGKSQRDIADALGITTSAISDWEKGRKKPRLSRLQEVADYFEVTTDYLTGGADFEDGGYYLDGEAAKLADFLHKSPEYKVLFDASKKVKPEDIDRVAKMIDLMRGSYDE